MATKSLDNPFDGDVTLTHTSSCKCDVCTAELNSPNGLDDKQRQLLMEKQADKHTGHHHHDTAPSPRV